MEDTNDTRSALERFMEQIPFDKLELPFSKAEGRRVALYMERYNADVDRQIAEGSTVVSEEDKLDPADLEDIATAVSGLVEIGLEADEAKHGLVGMLDGRVERDTPELRARMAAAGKRVREAYAKSEEQA